MYKEVCRFVDGSRAEGEVREGSERKGWEGEGEGKEEGMEVGGRVEWEVEGEGGGEGGRGGGGGMERGEKE